MQYSALHHRTWITPTVQKPCSHGLQNKKAMKSFDFTAFSGAMEGTRTPGLLIRSQSLYPAELPTHTFRPEQDVFYHSAMVLSTLFLQLFLFFFTTIVFHACARHFSQDFSRVHRRAFCPPPAQQGSVPVFLRCSSYMGILRQTLCARRVCALFPAKNRSKRKTSIFYDFSCIAFVILVL